MPYRMSLTYFGGSISEKVSGGYFSVEKYQDGVISQAKANLIRAIAEDAFEALKIKPPQASDSIEKIVESLKTKIPHPKSGKILSKDSTHQRFICETLANAINKRLPRSIIDTTLSPGEVCNNVATYMYSLFEGLKTEFVGVAGDVQRILNNMAVIRNTMEAAAEKLGQIIDDTAEPDYAAQREQTMTLYRELLREFDKQVAILSNLIGNTIPATTKTIAEISKDEKEHRGLIESMDNKVGTLDMSKKIGYVLANINQVAIMAKTVDKALADIGATVGDYKKSGNTKDLVDRLYGIWTKAHKHPNADELAKFIAALEIVRRNDYAHDDIAKYLEKASKNVGKVKGAGPEPGKKKSLADRIDAQKKTRDILFRDFGIRLKNHYKKIMQAVDALAEKMSVVPLNDSLDRFTQTFDDLAENDWEREKFPLALTGYYTDVVSRDERAQFLGRLDALSRAAAEMSRGPGGEQFSAFKKIIDDLRTIVDTFADTYGKAVAVPATTNVTGSALEPSEFPEMKRADNVDSNGGGRLTREVKVVEVEDDSDSDDERNDEHEMEGGAANEYPYASLKEAANRMRWFYNTAKIRANLIKSSAFNVELKEGYEKLLGNAVASFVVKNNADYEKTKKALEDDQKPEAGGHLKLWINEDEKKKAYRTSCRDSAIKLLDAQRQVKNDMLKTAEAVDMYLQEFTIGLSKNPDAVKKLADMLKVTDFIAPWFTEKSGDLLASLFESMPHGYADADNITPVLMDFKGESAYYQWIAHELKESSRLPANPFFSQLPGTADGKDVSRADEILEKAEKAVKNFRALENILNIFNKLGSEFGGMKPSSPMSIGTIYTNLRRYLFHSAITIGFDAEKKSGFTWSHGLINMNKDILPTAVGNVASTDRTAGAESIFLPARNPEANIGDKRANFILGMAMTSILGRKMQPANVVTKDVDIDHPINGYNNGWVITDRIFVMTVKAIVAKIFTVIETHTLLNKPIPTAPLMGPVRMILGGSADVKPEVIPEAMELYMRLPLYAEFYRELFKFGTEYKHEDGKTMDQFISMVPDFDGTFAGLLKVIFDDARHVNSGAYSDTHVKAIVSSINSIYKHYRTPGDKSTTQDAIHAFIDEINRRFGLITQKEMKQYEKERKASYEIENRYTEDRELPSIIDDGVDDVRRLQPSDQFDTSIQPFQERKVSDQWYDRFWKVKKIMTEFREDIDKQLATVKTETTKVSFRNAVRQYKIQLNEAKDNETRYRIVARAIAGTERLAVINNAKGIMFNELVIAPLSTLYTLWNVLHKFDADIKACDVTEVEKAIEAEIKKVIATPASYADYKKLHEELVKVVPKTKDLIKIGYSQDEKKAPQLYHTFYEDKKAAIADTNILVYGGTYGYEAGAGVAANLTAGSMLAMIKVNNKNNVEGAQRFMVNRELAFKNLVNALFRIHDLGFINVRVDEKNISVEFAQLIEVIKQIVNHVKKNIERFRGIIPAEVIAQYEGGSKEKDVKGDDVKDDTNVGRNIGSLYWLEENLVERFIKGRKKDDLSYVQINERIQTIFTNLIKKWNVTARVVATAFAGPYTNKGTFMDTKLAEHSESMLYDSYDLPLAELAFWKLYPVRPAAGISSHEMNPKFIKTDSKSWFHRIIPHDDQIDEEVKQFKALGESLLDTMRQIWRACDDFSDIKLHPIGSIASNAELINWMNIQPMTIPTGVASTATPADIRYALSKIAITDRKDSTAALNVDELHLASDFWDLNKGTGPWRIPGTRVSPFKKATDLKTDVQWNQVNIDDCVIDKIPDDLVKEFKKPNGDPKSVALHNLMVRYNTLYEQRDALRRTSWQAPLSQRLPIYNGPDGEKGAYLSYQIGDEQRGIIPVFNELLMRYLHMGWDNLTNKMYSKLIDGFANGTHHNATKGNAINDVANSDHGMTGLPPQHTVLFATLARIMRNIMTATKPKSSDALYRIDSLMDVPAHMKETLGADLPAFTKLFSQLLRKLELLRQVANQLPLVRQIPVGNNRFVADTGVVNTALLATNQYYHPSGVLLTGPAGPVPAGWTQGTVPVGAGTQEEANAAVILNQMNYLRNDKSSPLLYTSFAPIERLGGDDCKRWYNALFDDVTTAITSIMKRMSEVYKDLGVEPKFLETGSGSIINYMEAHKKRPIMLLSQMQIALRNRGDEKYAYPNFMLPFYRSGEQPHKFLYGVQSMINRPDIKPTLEFMPGMDDLFKQYNGVSSGDAKIDKSEFESFNESHVKVMRFLTDYRHYKAALGWGTTYDHGLLDAAKWSPKTQAYGFNKTLDEILGITESSDQDASVGSILRGITPKKDIPDDRDQARLINIVDMQIPPINPNAFARDIPLVHLHNYEYTLDRIVQDTLMARGTTLLKNNEPTTNVAQFITKTILHPHVPWTEEEFTIFFPRIAAGDTDKINMNEPQYIADQLFGKVLMQNRYPLSNGTNIDESGPKVDLAQARAFRHLDKVALVSTVDEKQYAVYFPQDAWYRYVIPANIAATIARNLLNDFTRGIAVHGNEPFEASNVLDVIQSALPAVMKFITDVISNRIGGPAVLNNLVFHQIDNTGTYRGQDIKDTANWGAIPAPALAPPSISNIVTTSTPGVIATHHGNFLTGATDATTFLGVDQKMRTAYHDDLYKAFPRAGRYLQEFIRADDLKSNIGVALSSIAMAVAKELSKNMRNEADKLSSLPSTRTMKYLGKENGAPKIIEHELNDAKNTRTPEEWRKLISEIGRLRTDTTLARNMLLTVQLQRFTQLFLTEALKKIDTPVVDGPSIANSALTELRS